MIDVNLENLLMPPLLREYINALKTSNDRMEAAIVDATKALQEAREFRDMQRQLIDLQGQVIFTHESWVRGREVGMRDRCAAETFAEEPDETPPVPEGEHETQWSAGWRRGWNEMAACVERDALLVENATLKARLEAK